ncbi:bile acid:sodium symporter family protein [Streptosporangium sp. NBC_01756]|uniref:bile acid:sodium symporter family protein n=1 Tax=Streptosporangium sp. NBC_01756 TaxID=2975950 RepID=UPI002DDBB382|nr:bile acid:sodium symporter [Streptosporangium sp. NBC_01756]WSC86513.1 bile acid:sodium symporter [Streptosporangium sp. NBC_01756]
MDVLQLLFNAVTVIFVAATMFAAGLGATLPALRAVFGHLWLLVLVLLANLAAVPLLGWGIAALFGLPTASFIALLLIASSPGGPFGAKLGMVQNGDVAAGAAMQVLLAAVGSITFGPTANLLLQAANAGGGVVLDVPTLILTVAVLQLVPFAVGLIVRHYAPPTALSWHPAAATTSNVTFLIVLAGMLLGNWRDVITLIGSGSLLAGFVFSGLTFALGTALATGPRTRRTTMGGVAAVRNAGPALAAAGIAFGNQPAILGALAAVLLSGLAAAIPIAAMLSRRRAAPPHGSDHLPGPHTAGADRADAPRDKET